MTIIDGYGSGDGSGSGSGSGYGYGYGSGDGDGSGSGSGSGHGSGYGDGNGNGFGYGYGSGDDYGDGFGKKKDSVVIYFRDGLELKIDALPQISKTRDGHIVERYTINGIEGFFVTIAGTPYCAHGSTLSQAISDAIWKDESKRPSLESLKQEIISSGKDRLITLKEFQLLTGACTEGCRIALNKKGLSGNPMTANDIYKHFPEWGEKLLNILGWR